MNKKQSPEDEVKLLTDVLKREKHLSAIVIFEKFKQEIIQAATESRKEKPLKKLSPFMYQLR